MTLDFCSYQGYCLLVSGYGLRSILNGRQRNQHKQARWSAEN